MPPKRRVLVVYEPEPPAKRIKLAVLVDKEATNDALAREIAESVGSEEVKLEIGDGFELRRQDGVEMILDSDIVTARPRQPHGPAVESTPHLLTFKPTQDLDQEDGEDQKHNRYQIQLVSGELARAHAKETLTQPTEPTNGVLAFDGQFVNENTTLSSLKQEAVWLLGWKSFGESFEDEPCNHEARAVCSCPTALEVESYELSSTLHCRFSVDGTKCMNDDCSYTHISLSNDGSGSLGADAPHCTVCGDALAFPCPSCLKYAEEKCIDPSAVIHCPIVKNAICGHMHHAHCLGPRKKEVNGCPSGCSGTTTHREGIPLDQDAPTITLVWDVDQIERLPIPSHYLDTSGSMQHLNADVVVSIVESFLQSKFVDLNGLSLRLHGRDANTEMVRFVWTTLVSVCTTSLHQNPDHRRFSFPGAVTPASAAPTTGREKPFEIDFHTSSCPIVVCGCTRLKDIFPSNPGESNKDTKVTLYVVKRSGQKGSAPTSKHSTIPVSKQSAYQYDAAWQPSTQQTPRGMAALLSSLFVLSVMVQKQGVTSENKILAALYSITRFPPAVRALGMLLLNIALHPQEKAALSEALFHALKDFSHAASIAFTINASRRFETVRIFLGHLLTITDVANAVNRPLQPFSLICTLSNKRLVDPVLFNTFAIVERSSGSLHAIGGLLCRPKNGAELPSISELLEGHLRQVVAQSKEFNRSEVYALLVNELGKITRPVTLENAGRDFSIAIQRANETDLISRGPLELKSPSVVPPQIVLDSEGLLAVFTGRGCGATRDVNFFLPLSGGDTEVDVNDVEHALQRVIAARKAEDTWDVDCFGGIPAKARTPDEAIVLCLDLSQSMNEKSAVGQSGPRARFDHEAEGEKVVDEVVHGLSDDVILANAKKWVEEQHESCFVVWKASVGTYDLSIERLVEHLGTILQRNTLRNKLTSTSGILEVNDRILKRASFSSASRLQTLQITEFLEDFLEDFQPSEMVGEAPFDVPRELVDLVTGDLIQTPSNFDLPLWTQWTSGQDILDDLKSGERLASGTVTITLRLRASTPPVVWQLPISTSTQDLYSLANRVTRAEHSYFNLRDCNSSRTIINCSANLTLLSTVLNTGGAVEVWRPVPHHRKPLEFTLETMDDEETILLPSDASALALISSAWGPDGSILSDIQLWGGLTDAGDGKRNGIPIGLDSYLEDVAGTSIECDLWEWRSVRTSSEISRSLTRLDLLKELFNIFLNRVSSFDTSVSLVLGLVTFADNALLKQELTPIFENFRQELERVDARGDTAMFDALDLARSCLVNFRRDLPNLRRRIIVVSDGEDTGSEASIADVGSALQRDGIIVDSVQVGRTLSHDLHKVSAATGGYRFFPQLSLGDALSIFDLETMMNSAERPVRPKMGRAFSLPGQVNLVAYPIDIVTIDKFPERAQHPRLTEKVKDVKQAATVSFEALNSERTRRIMREIKSINADPHPQIDVYVAGDDMSFLKVIMQAPDDIEQCPYKGGCFLLTCDLPPEYPRDPPEIRFVTFILHPNVSKQGKVCIAELSRLWSSEITLKELFSLVYGLLLEPDLDNPLEIQASLKYYDDDGTFALAAAKAVAEHATKPRSEWQQELGV